MKRRYVMLGLLVLVIFVLLFALAGPASAATGKKVYFDETSVMWPSATNGDPSDPDQWTYSKMWTGPTGVFHVKNWLWEGPTTFVPADPARPLDFAPVAYAYDYISAVAGNTIEKMTSYVGATSAADVAAGHYDGIWRISAVSHLAPDGTTSLYTCQAQGVAGVVKGFVMRFRCEVGTDAMGLSVGTGSGYYIAK